MLDLIIKNGKIIDGSGGCWFRADVGILGERIAKIGHLAEVSAHEIIDARDRYVCPGFIDLHSHTDLLCTLPQELKLQFFGGRITQGITTEINGNCGIGVAPVTDSSRQILRGISNWFSPSKVNWEWTSFESYLGRLQRSDLIANVGLLVTHGAVRVAVMGMTSDNPTREELVAMKKLISQAMKQGALGMSTGLIYPPGMYSQTEELIELAAEVARYNGTYTSHIRGSSDILIPSVKELLKIGSETGVHVHHSHHGAVGKENWWKLDRTLAMEEEARDRGTMVTFDVIPYHGATTGMGVIFPPWSIEGGLDSLMRNLTDQRTHEKIRWEIENTVPGWPPWIKGCWGQNYVRDIGWENIQIASVVNEKNKAFEGMSLSEYAESIKKSPFDAAADLMIEEQGNVTIFLYEVSGRSNDEKPIDKLIVHPMSAIVSDAYDLGRGKPHPAAYGTFPWVLHHYVKERRLIRLEDAIRKMTSFPAQVVGIYDRGLIRESMMADLLIIDMENIRGNATFDSPRELSQGIDYVIINGTVVVKDGDLKPLFPGKVLGRRS